MFGGGDRPAAGAAAPAVVETAVPDTPVQLGAAYSVGGQSYTPIDQTDYDEVGYASWYGDELAGRPTANGESFTPDGVSAAHRTLPMPSYLEVTRLDTGATILVRVNDRGPADARRLIDLSAGAARQLGLTAAGLAPVRVRRVNPVDAERLTLRRGGAVPARLPTPESLLSILRERAARLPVPTTSAAAPAAAPVAAATPRPAAAPPPASVRAGAAPRPAAAVPGPPPAPAAATPAPAASGTIFVQIGAFSSRSRADELARRLGASVASSGNLHRVRLGPFATPAQAAAAQAEARRRGYPGSVIVRNP